jgi:hypothetical protein
MYLIRTCYEKKDTKISRDYPFKNRENTKFKLKTATQISYKYLPYRSQSNLSLC